MEIVEACVQDAENETTCCLKKESLRPDEVGDKTDPWFHGFNLTVGEER